MIPDEVVDQVREVADIVQVIGEYVDLKRMGVDYRGPCPFHQGTHRNFSVSTKKRMYYCFVCHEGGDVFSFVQKRLGLDWPAAVRLVAEKSGIEVREVESRREGPDPRDPLREVNAAAAEYFQRILWEDELGRPAREYLASRRITREQADRFGLGFAPRELGLMRSHLGTLGFDDQRLLEAGLLVQMEESAEPRPRFRGRLIFPIQDVGGHYVGFGGRLIGPGEPKYLNSAESPVFSKGKLLYGLYWAKNSIRRDDRLLVVEGYFDVVRLMAAGIETVVAPLGTALTEEQARLVTRFTKNVFLLYDSDDAGLKATFRSGDELLRQGASVQVVTLPEGEDPDSFVDRNGAQALASQLADAVDVFERKIMELDRRGYFADLRRRRRAIDRLLPTIRATSDPLMRDLYVGRASEKSGISRELLMREVLAEPESAGPSPRSGRGGEAPGRSAGGGSDGPSYDGPPPEAPPFDEPRRGGFKKEWRRGDRRRPEGPRSDPRPPRVARGPRGGEIERDIVRAMLFDRSQVDAVSVQMSPDAFRDRRYRAIFAAFLDVGAEASLEELAEALDDDAQAELGRLVETLDNVANPPVVVADALLRLRERELDDELARVQEALEQADGDEKDALLMRKKALTDERAKLPKPRRFKLFDRPRS